MAALAALPRHARHSIFGAEAHRIEQLLWPCVVPNSDPQGTIWPSSHPYRAWAAIHPIVT
jgi:hypothetical protein